MNSMRKFFCVLTAVLFAAFALPSFAEPANKHFALTMVVGVPVTYQQDTIVTANLANDNPSGSSAQFGSFVISVSNISGITITSAEADLAYGSNQVVTPSADGLSVTVSNLSPNVKATQTYSLKLHIKGCGDGNTWSATVWTGTYLTGTTYSDDHKGNETTNVP